MRRMTPDPRAWLAKLAKRAGRMSSQKLDSVRRQAWCLSIMDPPGIGHGIKKLCAGAVVCEGYDAPVQAPARPAQLSMEKHICF